jgi:hypothetical protein
MKMQWSGKRIVAVGVSAAVALTCIIFAIPFNTVPYNTVETYEDTETKQEPYEATEPYVSLEMCEREEIIFQGTPYSVPLGINIPFSVVKAGARLVGIFELPALGGFYLYSSAGKVLYEQRGARGNVNIPLTEGDYRVMVRERVSWEGRVNIDLRLKWTEPGEVTRYREVTKYREVPVTVEKERTVTKYKKASLWQIIFGH